MSPDQELAAGERLAAGGAAFVAKNPDAICDTGERDVPQPRLGQICRKVTFWRTIVLRHLAAL
eukprot:906926-Prymnesium_polylepis.1